MNKIHAVGLSYLQSGGLVYFRSAKEAEKAASNPLKLGGKHLAAAPEVLEMDETTPILEIDMASPEDGGGMDWTIERPLTSLGIAKGLEPEIKQAIEAGKNQRIEKVEGGTKYGVIYKGTAGELAKTFLAQAKKREEALPEMG